MPDLSRRALLASVGAAAIVAALPAPAGLPAAVPPAPSAPPLPTWIVGTPGEWDHEIIRAATREAAIRFRAEACEFEDDPDADPDDGEGGPDCACEACTANAGYEASRVVAFDGRPPDEITSGDWIAAGFGARCNRCRDETFAEEGGRAIGGKAVCGFCLTPADLAADEPERAAEMREEWDDA